VTAAIQQLIRSLQYNYELAHRDAHTMKPKTKDQVYHLGYQNGRVSEIGQMIGTLQALLAISEER